MYINLKPKLSSVPQQFPDASKNILLVATHDPDSDVRTTALQSLQPLVTGGEVVRPNRVLRSNGVAHSRYERLCSERHI